MFTLPLVSHTTPDSIIAWRADGAVTRHQFLAEVQQLSALFPSGGRLLNLCRDRYQFSVGLAAAIVTGKVSLLPPAHTPEMMRQIRIFAPDVFCLTDSDDYTLDLPQLRYPVMPVNHTHTLAVPQIDRQQHIAVVFTSGSTGTPQPHPKTWGALVNSVQAEARRLGLFHTTSCTLLGTVPPQHMYGFESTVLMAWHSRNILSHAQPFYPADIGQALAAVPAPRGLISSPVHLRALLETALDLPELTLVLSSTAPLSTQLAHDIEARCRAPLFEIYGSTETGLIATRHPTQTTEWHLLPSITLRAEADRVYACGGHIEAPTPMSDHIEILSNERFLLHGRLDDLINIAGKRHSLASLNHLLNAIPGVVDGAFFMPDETGAEHVTRLAACVVAPDIETAWLLAALRERMDPVFLPRPLLLMETLPRNSTGKLPRSTLQALLQAHKLRPPV